MKKLILLFLSIISSSTAQSQQATLADFGFYEFDTGGGEMMPYRMMKPFEYDSLGGEEYPVFIWAHPNGRQGTNNTNQMNDGWAPFLMDGTMRDTYPSFVIAPQCKSGIFWNSQSYINNVIDLVNELQTVEAIDMDRIYIMGWSMGGVGIWRTLNTPEGQYFYAAAVPIAGASNGPNPSFIPADYDGIVWAGHGSNDNTLNVTGTRQHINAIRDAGFNAIYSEFAVGHGSHDETMTEPSIWTWVFSQNRSGGNLPPAPTNVVVNTTGSTATLTWDVPAVASSVDSIMAYNVYKNGVRINTSISDLADSTGTGINELTRVTEYVDLNHSSGDSYEVRSVNFRNQESLTATGISEVSQAGGFLKSYPNPTSGKVILEADGVEGAAFNVYDQNGKRVLEGIVENREVDLSSISAGIYSVQIENQAIKILKE